MGDARAAQSVHRTTADEPEQTGGHAGPTILFDRTRQDPPPLASIVSFWADAQRVRDDLGPDRLNARRYRG